MKIEKLIVGQLATNCYLVWEEKSKEAIIIDPGDDGDYIVRRIQDLKLLPKLILTTHGHFDHVLAATELKLALGLPFLIHEKDLFLLKKAEESARHYLGINVDPITLPDKLIKENEEIKFGREKLRVMETPGHTPGSVCLYSSVYEDVILGSASWRTRQARMTKKRVLFSGDSLFADGVGRTDFSYSSKEDLKKSLKKLFKLSGDTLVCPGHGEETTMVRAKNARDFYVLPKAKGKLCLLL